MSAGPAGAAAAPSGGARRLSVSHAAAAATDDASGSFESFLAENKVSREVYELEHALPRFLRANPRREGGPVTLAELRASLPPGAEADAAEVDGFFRVSPGDTPVAPLPLYRAGDLYGMDLASALAVEALHVRPGDHVLDLCAAPGAKMCMAADRLEGRGTVTGVDVSAERMKIVRNLVRRHRVPGVRMYRADGRSFSLPPSDAPVYHCKVTDLKPGQEAAGDGARRYDRVLVDAECTHDGSVRHVNKLRRLGWERARNGFMEPGRLAGLWDLQRALLANGFRMLREGGDLVYSTCSFARRQNEDVVAWLLAEEPSAELLPLELPASPASVARSPGIEMPLAARYDPYVSGTSGLFVARLTRRPSG